MSINFVIFSLAMGLMVAPSGRFSLGDSKESSRSYIRLDRLPKLFRDLCPYNSGYPAVKRNCYNNLGCIKELPTHLRAMDPKQIGSTFTMFGRYQPDAVQTSFHPMEYCLMDHSSCENYPFNPEILASYRFKKHLRTLIVVPGYWSGDHVTWMVQLKDRWLQRENANVILVSWADGNNDEYETAVANTPIVARQITILLHYLAEVNQVDLQEELAPNIYIVGHSLGALCCF